MWRVQLAGDPSDLESLAAEPTSAEWSIQRHGEQFMLTSISFDPMADRSTIWSLADDLVARIDRAARLRMSGFGGIRAAALRQRRDNDGSRIDISVRDSLTLSVRETGEVRVGLDAVGKAPTKPAMPPCPGLPDLVALQQANPRFGDALSYLKHDDDWPDYYKAFEALRAAVGAKGGSNSSAGLPERRSLALRIRRSRTGTMADDHQAIPCPDQKDAPSSSICSGSGLSGAAEA